MSVIVFAGPTIDADSVTDILQAHVLPPVKQGDVYRAVSNGPKAIGIIDGYFEGVPSVWHKEILWAIEQGVAVFGSASMGALRAAELADFGMVGVGRIFESYKDGQINDDDEVAVLHSPAELGFKPLSEPMVSIRATVQRALDERVLDENGAEHVLRFAKGLHYHHRTWPAIEAEFVSDLKISGFLDWLPNGKVDAKREDAREMLSRMAEYLSEERPRVERPQKMERTLVWKGLVRRVEAEAETDTQKYVNRDVLNELRLDPKLYSEVCDRAAFRMLVQSGGSSDTARPETEQLRRQMAIHRQNLGLKRRLDLIEWLQENDLDETGYEDLLSSSHHMETVISNNGTELETQILAELKWSGDYARLNERAKVKAKFFDNAQASAAGFAAKDRLNVLMWYFESLLGTSMPEDLQAYAQSLGLAQREEFCKLVEREFMFSQSTFDRNSANSID